MVKSCSVDSGRFQECSFDDDLTLKLHKNLFSKATDQSLVGMFVISFNNNIGGQLIKSYNCTWRGLIKSGDSEGMEMTAGHYLSLGHSI